MENNDTATTEPESEPEPELSEFARTSIRRSLTKYGVGLNDSGSGAVSVIDRSTRTDEQGNEVAEFEVLVDTAGRLDLDEVLNSNQGRLLFCRDGVEVMLRGFEDGDVLVDVTQELGKYDLSPIFGCERIQVTTEQYGEIELEVHTSESLPDDLSTEFVWRAEVDAKTNDDVPPLVLEVTYSPNDEPVVSLSKPKPGRDHLFFDEIDVVGYEVIE